MIQIQNNNLLGPGKGTLMKEILRTSQTFPYFKKALTIHMVEVSEVMRNIQRKKLLPELSNSNIDYVCYYFRSII